MINLTTLFDEATWEDAWKCLLDLPESIRPTKCSDSESPRATKIELNDCTAFHDFVAKNPDGFFLHSKTCLFDLSRGRSSIDIWIRKKYQDFPYTSFFDLVSVYRPTFGYAASPDEYEHRNRLITKIGPNRFESWVGRDLDRSVPGLYWMVMIPDHLSLRHNLDMDKILSSTIKVHRLAADNGSLLTFFEDPTVWKEHVARLDRLCDEVRGIFSIGLAEEAIEKADSRNTYFEILSAWR